MNDIKIIDIQYEVGEEEETLADIAEKFNLGLKRFQTLKRVGIERIFKFDQQKSGLKKHLVNLVQRILEKNKLRLSEISGIFGSGNPVGEYLVPNLTTVIGYEAGLRNISSKEIGQGCAGGIQVIESAYSQLRSDSLDGIDSIYIVMGWEDVNVAINQKDHTTATLFSDACYVMLVSNRSDLDGRKIKFVKSMSLLTEDIFTMTIENPFYTDSIANDFINNCRFKMNGPLVYKFGLKLFDYIKTLTKGKYTEEQLRSMYMIPHQANKRMILAMAKKYNLDENLICTDGVGKYGNTANSSAFISLKDNFDRKGTIMVTPFGLELMTGVLVIE